MSNVPTKVSEYDAIAKTVQHYQHQHVRAEPEISELLPKGARK